MSVRKEHRLRAFENRMLRKIFGSRKVDVTGGWRKLHNEQLHNVYYSPNVMGKINSWRMQWKRHVARMGSG
jgi:hypothetical protein